MITPHERQSWSFQREYGDTFSRAFCLGLTALFFFAALIYIGSAS